jgi:16S rRNA G966 N2-methylase RsmD
MDTDFIPETINVPAVSYPTQMSGLVTEIHSDPTVRPADPKDLPGLIHFNRARRELELASSIDEVKQIRDQAEAMRIYARQVRCSLEMQNMCAEIKIRAERKLGEMLRESDMADRKQGNLLRGRTMQPRDDGLSLKELGISKSQSSRCQMIACIDANSFEEKIEELKVSGKELTSTAMVDYAKYHQREQARATEQELAVREGEAGDPAGNIMILHGDFREVLTESVIADGSVDLVLTDPPYGEEFLPLWSDLGRFAARVLKPGKILASYSGIYHLDKVMERLGEHLQYLWTAILINNSPPDTVFPRHIMTYWKPVLLFSNGVYRPLKKKEWFRDRIEGDGRVKDHHEWQQGVGEARQLVEALTHEGNLVVDPFAGSGTIGVACKQLNRRYRGCDVDEASVISARKRIQQGR